MNVPLLEHFYTEWRAPSGKSQLRTSEVSLEFEPPSWSIVSGSVAVELLKGYETIVKFRYY
jgi:hypothetical protein